MKKIIYLSVVLVAFLGACGILKMQYNTIYLKYNVPKLLDTTTITKGGVSITLSNTDLNEYFRSEYAAEIKVLWGKNGYTSTRNTVINLFMKMTAYKVEIVNNTKNVLSLEDARVTLILPEAGEPVFALAKTEMLADARNGSLPCILFEREQINRAYTNVINTTSVYEYLNTAVGEMIKSKVIVSRSTEVMPNMKVVGYVVFPYDSEKINEGTVSFIDVKSETNEAGDVTLKTRFDFRVKQTTIYAKREYDQEQRKYLQYVPINEVDYNASQQSKE
jgi:hypothetical protein